MTGHSWKGIKHVEKENGRKYQRTLCLAKLHLKLQVMPKNMKSASTPTLPRRNVGKPLMTSDVFAATLAHASLFPLGHPPNHLANQAA